MADQSAAPSAAPPHPATPHPFAGTRQGFAPGPGKRGELFSLPALGQALGQDLARLPVCLRLLLESLLRQAGGTQVLPAHVQALAAWQPVAAQPRPAIPVLPARLLLDDQAAPLLAGLSAQRQAAIAHGGPAPALALPVDLVVDHAVPSTHWGDAQALGHNLAQAFSTHAALFSQLQQAQQALPPLRVWPPGFGSADQLNLELLAPGVHRQDKARGAAQLHHPDSLLGTGAGTALCNALGVPGWTVGAPEALAALQGQPVWLPLPDVVGVELRGQLRPGITSTDLALTLNERLAELAVAGQFVEFFGDGTAALGVPERATLAGLLGATGASLGHFAVDEMTLAYLRGTGRPRAEVAAVEAWFKAQGLFGTPRRGQISYSRVLTLALAEVGPSVLVQTGAQAERCTLPKVAARMGGPHAAATAPQPATGKAGPALLRPGEVLVASLCGSASTTNPGLMLAAGLLAQKAVARGLTVAPHIRTTLAPGSRVVSEYLDAAGLLKPLRKLGFYLVDHGAGQDLAHTLEPASEARLHAQGMPAAAVHSGTSDAATAPAMLISVQASPPLVVAWALAGHLGLDLASEPLGLDTAGKPVLLRELWPSPAELQAVMKLAMDAGAYRKLATQMSDRPGLAWKALARPVA